jgi:hypothetical protein
VQRPISSLRRQPATTRRQVDSLRLHKIANVRDKLPAASSLREGMAETLTIVRVGLLTQPGSRLGPVSSDSWKVIAIFTPIRGMKLAPLRGAIVPGGGRRYMGQIAGFQETSPRVAMTGEGVLEDQAGRGLAVLIVKLIRCC